MIFDDLPKTRKTQNFTSGGTWPNPGGVDTIWVSGSGGEANIVSGNANVAGKTDVNSVVFMFGGQAVFSISGESGAIPPQIVSRVPVDVSGNANATITIGAGAGGGANGWVAVEWDQ